MDAPLYQKLRTYNKKGYTSFHMPVHRNGAMYDAFLRKHLLSLDYTELADTDNLANASGCILHMHQNMADTFRADHAHLLVNGSTGGIHAMLFACLGRGEKILLDRNVHQSVLNACLLFDLDPVYIDVRIDPHMGIVSSISAEAVAQTLSENPDAKAVLITSPTYFGVVSDVQKIAQAVHQYRIPLLVDCAHGSHFAFSDRLPLLPTELGADACVLSLHKTLGALTQTGLLLHSGSLLSWNRLQVALRLLQTTSPSYVMMSCADYVCAYMQENGKPLLDVAIDRTAQFRQSLERKTNCICHYDNVYAYDPLRLVINVSHYGITGLKAAQLLHDHFYVDVEMADSNNIVCIISHMTRASDFKTLLHSLLSITKDLPSVQKNLSVYALPAVEPAIRPYTAYCADIEMIPLQACIGRISAGNVSVYPPGVPAVFAGCRISRQAVTYICTMQKAGAVITGLCEGGLPVVSE